ncbi:MAG: hypothetical protein MUO72_18000 [Bacteroidales bacterium]|nr:hypothetical protein [Bacteroidales bacterium]
MKKKRFIFFLVFLFFSFKSYSQDFQLTKPRLVFDGTKLLIFYNIIAQNPEDQFYIWVEMERANGEIIEAKNLSGDVGYNVKRGNSKKIIWIPKQDSIFLDEDIFVEVKAEKYMKSFYRGSMILRSIIFPGWGQTNISNGKPWWLTGLAFYGTLAGGYLCYQDYVATYDNYRSEADDAKVRADLFKHSRRQYNNAVALLCSGAAIWGVNILWVTFTPNRYQHLQNLNLSLKPTPVYNSGTPLITLSLTF